MPRGSCSSWSSSSCCPDVDEKVRVNSSDNAGFLFPKLCAGNNITLTEVEQSAWVWCVRIDGPDVPCTPTLTAADASITVTQPTPCNRVIKANCCDNADKFVATNAWCTPGYLIDQIIWVNPIKVDQVWCQVQISFDGSSLPDIDQKVAVNAWCTPDYLDPLIYNTPSILKEVNACKMWFNINPWRSGFKRPRAKIGIWNRQELWWPLKPPLPIDREDIWSFLLPQKEAHADFQSMISADNVITIPKAWPYMVTMKGIAEINDWVHAARLFLQSSNADADGGLDDKFSASYSSWALDSVISKCSIWGTTTTSTWNKIWWWGLMVLWFGQSDLFIFAQWDTVRPVLKYSTFVNDKYRKSSAGHITLPGTDWGRVTPPATSWRGKRAWVTLSVHYVWDTWII